MLAGDSRSATGAGLCEAGPRAENSARAGEEICPRQPSGARCRRLHTARRT